MKRIKEIFLLIAFLSVSANIFAGKWVNWNAVMTDVSNGINTAVDCVKNTFFGETTSVVGTNVIITKKVEITNINSVVVSGAGLVIVTQDSMQPEELIIEVDEAVMPYIETKIVGNELSIRLQNNISVRTTTQDIYHIRVKDFTKMDISGVIVVEMKEVNSKVLKINVHGASKITGTLTAKELDIYATGASQIVLSGIANKQTVSISGSSIFDGQNLQGQEIVVNGKGAVEVYSNVSDTISGRLSDASSLRYNGTPIVNIWTSGAGSIKKL
jgi:hypothetical protein